MIKIFTFLFCSLCIYSCSSQDSKIKTYLDNKAGNIIQEKVTKMYMDSSITFKTLEKIAKTNYTLWNKDSNLALYCADKIVNYKEEDRKNKSLIQLQTYNEIALNIMLAISPRMYLIDSVLRLKTYPENIEILNKVYEGIEIDSNIYIKVQNIKTKSSLEIDTLIYSEIKGDMFGKMYDKVTAEIKKNATEKVIEEAEKINR